MHPRKVPIHDGKEIEVVYTNDLAEVKKVLRRWKRNWIRGYEYFLGLDFEYTNDKSSGEKVAVFQLSYRQEVLVFHWSRYIWIVLVYFPLYLLDLSSFSPFERMDL